MIGDWVKWEYVSYPDVVFNYGYKQVAAIYGDESVDLIDEDTLYEHVPMDEIKVVELTAEILGKNGFKYHHVKGTCATEEYTDYILDNTLWIIHNTEDWKDTYFCIKDFCRIKYVQELQHAVRLCGVEKEIEL